LRPVLSPFLSSLSPFLSSILQTLLALHSFPETHLALVGEHDFLFRDLVVQLLPEVDHLRLDQELDLVGLAQHLDLQPE
jgi:hypothetical protein